MCYPKICPICGHSMEEGYCLNCGYDVFLDVDLSISSTPKSSNGILDSLLSDLSGSEEKDPFDALFDDL